MTRHETIHLLRCVHPQCEPLPESQSPSTELERDALRESGDRDAPAEPAPAPFIPGDAGTTKQKTNDDK